MAGRTIHADVTLEDLTFLASTGASLTEAAHRAGFASREALDKWLRRHKQVELLTRLLNQETRVA